MKPKVYIETSIVSYLTARPSSDTVTAGHQSTRMEWWKARRQYFQIVASELVVQEASLGDFKMAAKRLDALKEMTILTVHQTARDLAK